MNLESESEYHAVLWSIASSVSVTKGKRAVSCQFDASFVCFCNVFVQISKRYVRVIQKALETVSKDQQKTIVQVTFWAQLYVNSQLIEISIQFNK